MLRILHISDLHISTEASDWGVLDRAKNILDLSFGTIFRTDKGIAQVSSYSLDKLQAVANLVKDINGPSNPVDAVLVTGDISTTGQLPDLRQALELFEGQPGRIDRTITAMGFPTLAGFPGLKFILLPGNHDRYQTDSTGTYGPGGRQFDRVFHDHWAGIVQSRILADEHVEVGVVSADLSLDSVFDTNGHNAASRKINAFAQGRARKITIELMVKNTRKLIEDITGRGKKAMILWAMHFPPIYPHMKPSHKLIGEDFVILAANKCGVEAILCGHNHKYNAYDTPEDPRIFCTGTTSQDYAPDGNFCQLLEIDCEKGGQPTFNNTVYRYNMDNNEFIIDGTK